MILIILFRMVLRVERITRCTVRGARTSNQLVCMGRCRWKLHSRNRENRLEEMAYRAD